MIKKLSSQKILVLGGTGLIGKEIVKRLAKDNFVTVVSLGLPIDNKNFEELTKDYSDVEHVTGNVFLPTTYKDGNFSDLLKSPEFINEYLELLYNNTGTELYIANLIKEFQPNILIDAVNSATILSYTPNVNLIKNYLNGGDLDSKTILATLPIPRLINYFNTLYKAILEAPSLSMFLKIGTTGTGGMGFNIPYTHGERKPSYNLLEKAAISGAYTSLLYLLSKTFGLPVIKEIKPAALVGYREIGYGPIRVGNNENLKVYEFNQLNNLDIKTLTELDFEKLTFPNQSQDIKAVFVDTGENGQFAEEEFRTISNNRQMGFVTKEEIADVVLAELSGQDSNKDIIRHLANGVVGPSEKAQGVRAEVLENMTSLSQEVGNPSLAFEVLGPPRLAKLIFEVYLVKKLKVENDIKIEDLDTNDIPQVVATGIPILFEDGTLLVGKKPKLPSQVEKITPKNIDTWAYNGWVDLRNQNLKLWQKRINEFNSTHSNWQIGDIVAWIFEKEDKGFRQH